MTQHSKQDTLWRVPTTTLFLIALWVMTASFKGVLNILQDEPNLVSYKFMKSSMSGSVSKVGPNEFGNCSTLCMS